MSFKSCAIPTLKVCAFFTSLSLVAHVWAADISFFGSGTGGGRYSVTVAGVTADTGPFFGGVGHCYAKDTETKTVSLLPGKQYTCTINDTDHLLCAICVAFFDIPDCYDLVPLGTVFGGAQYCTDTSQFIFTVELRERDYIEAYVSPSPLKPDGQSHAYAWLNYPDLVTQPISWSIVSADKLGCQIDSTSGVVTAGNNEGTITIRATDSSSPPCHFDVDLELAQCSSCSSGCQSQPGSISAENGSVNVKIALGQKDWDENAGAIILAAATPTNSLSTPLMLRYPYRRNGVELITGGLGLRQVKAQQALAYITTNSLYKYYVDFYALTNVLDKTNGVYQLQNSYFARITVENPDNTGATTNQLRITDGDNNVYDYVWKTNGWELTSGGGLRKEFKSTIWTNTNTIKLVTTEIRNASDQLVATSTEKYQAFTWGTNLIEETSGAAPNARTNTYAGWSDGTLQKVTRADGSWEYYFYDTNQRPVSVYSAFLNQDVTTNSADCKLVHNSYTPVGTGDTGYLEPHSPRDILTIIKNKIVGRQYLVVKPGERSEIVCLATNASWNDANNLVTVTRTFTNGFFKDRIQSVFRPDGTVDLYQYAQGPSYFTNIVLSGHPNASTNDVDDGTKTIAVFGSVGELVSKTIVDIASTITNSYEVYSDYDAFQRPQKLTHIDGTYDYKVYGCCGVQTETNREGTVTTYTYDGLKRPESARSLGITNQFTYDAVGNVLVSTRTGTDHSSITTSSAGFDLAGRQITSTNAVGDPTLTVESLPPVFITNTFPNGSKQIESRARDGTLLSVTGDATHPVRYTKDVVVDGVDRLASIEIKLNSDGTDSAEKITNFFDLAGRVYKTAYSGTNGAATLYYFNSLGQMTNQVDPDGVSTFYGYNSKGELEYSVVDMNRNGQIDWTGSDRITRTVNMVTNNGSLNLQRTRTYVWNTTNDSGLLISQNDRTVDGLRSWSISFGLTNQSWTAFANGHRSVTNTAPDGSCSVSDFQSGRLLSSYRKDSGGGYLSQIGYSYDAHGRQNAVTNTPVGATTYAFDNADRVTGVTTPSPAQITSMIYNNMGWVATNVLSDNQTVTSEYFATGELKKKYGAREYPVEYTYDSQGRLKTMKTWQNYAGNSGTATTTWNYDSYRGFLNSKVYADSTGPTYTYTAAGRLKTRAWARGITTTFSLDAAGTVTNVAYSDGTPSVLTVLDRLGRPSSIIQGTNTTDFTYNDAGAVLTEACSAGVLANWQVQNAYDSLNRRTSVGTLSNSVSATVATNSYDAASRMAYISDGTYNATYAYLTNSSLVTSIVMKSNTTTRLTIAKGYDNLYRLLVISNIPSADSAMTFSYAYNSANQRTAVTNVDGSRWLYGYDSLGQVTSGKRYWSDGTPVAGEQFEYSFDDIGNRKYAAEGGNQWGTGLRYQNYTANNLNQHTQRTVPGKVDIIGAANSAATVTVNLGPTYRHGEYFRAEPKINNTTSAVYQSMTNVGVLANGTNADIVTTNSGYALIPKTPEVFAYDLDGNLVTNGLWVLTWDGENRLVGADSASGVPASAKQSLRFKYDYQGRRISKTVSNWAGSAWSLGYSTKFIYDAWGLLAELNATNNASLRSYVWGNDASGMSQGAGNMSGLLMMRDSSGSATTNEFYAYDANQNVRMMTRANDGISALQIDYDPFGSPLRANGNEANPFRFSTKYQDFETGWTSYPQRYLASGRWISRDPIAEEGGLNGYCFVENEPLGGVDPLGLARCTTVGPTTAKRDDPKLKQNPDWWGYTNPKDDVNPKRENCGAQDKCRKYRNINFANTSTIILRPGSQPSDPTYAGSPVTLLKHEKRHATINCEAINQLESAYADLKTCQCVQCMNAWVAYIDAYTPYVYKLRDAKSDKIDAEDHRPGSLIATDYKTASDQKFAEAAGLLSAANQLRDKAQALLNKMGPCK